MNGLKFGLTLGLCLPGCTCSLSSAYPNISVTWGLRAIHNFLQGTSHLAARLPKSQCFQGSCALQLSCTWFSAGYRLKSESPAGLPWHATNLGGHQDDKWQQQERGDEQDDEGLELGDIA